MSSFDIDKLDDVIHSRLRLGIMTLLADSEAETFNALKEALKATQGNLSIQLRKLEEAGYVSIDKQIDEFIAGEEEGGRTSAPESSMRKSRPPASRSAASQRGSTPKSACLRASTPPPTSSYTRL